jgi:hypothetical protein
MDEQKPTGTRGALLLILALVLLAVALTGCGIGRASNQEKVSKTATSYLRALANGETAKACAQLSQRASSGECEATMKKRLSRLEADALTKAADGSMDIAVHGNTATAGLSEPTGARFVLKKVGGEWLIDSGYTLTGGASPALTTPQYQALLTKANARIQTTETAAEKIGFAPHASHARAAAALGRWADAEATNARILAAANPPVAARKANTLLASAERLEASELQHLARIVRTTPGAGHVMTIAQRTMTPRAGALLDRAIAQLHKLGYR